MSKEYKQYQEGLIRSILARPEEIVNVLDFVDSKDFEDINFKTIYESILDLHLEGKSISLPEIALKIGESGGAIDTGWLFNLQNNMAQWIQAAPPRTWARLLKKESTRNLAKEVLKESLSEIEKKESNPLNIMDSTTSKLSKVSLSATSTEMFDINDAVDEFEEETREIIESGGKVDSINSAYPTIDYYTKGWNATHLITVGARTGVGKSVFAINNAIAAMEQEKTVLFFSLEMTRREVISRMIASLSLIPIQKIEKALPLTDDELQRQKEALQTIRKSKLKIDTNPEVTVEYIKRASVKQAQSEDGLDFIIIDYLQLISSDSKGSRQEEVASVSRNMKILAKELNVPVMVLVQLNREKRDDEDTTPKIYDIRESGAIAQDSNVVILIDRKVDDEDSEMIDPKATFIIAKNRQGDSNKYITVRTRLESSLFIDDNPKGQKLVQDLQASVENDGNYELNMNNQEERYSQFDNVDVNNDNLEHLFSEDNGFAKEEIYEEEYEEEDFEDAFDPDGFDEDPWGYED